MITRRTALATLAATTLPGSFAFAQDETITVPDMRLGNELAKVTVTEYASFTCPHCASFHANTYPQLKANYIDTDKINFVYREVYFDRFGLWGAMIARCDPSKFFGISDMLYKRQAEWSRAGEPAEIVAEMRKIGKIAGLSDDQLDECLNNQKMAEAMVARFQETSTADEVNSTPTLFVNGTKYGNLPYAELAEIIEAELGS
ncbi:DsbA family protein [Neptunicoccus cionae]|uniref:Thiol-disulfide oxidoreductase n=1 Tax=Neptunicoccus cionae TaxID=2035344 RepID=A0A916QXB1_9RHOB|nr:DsbA family protein [Amylibacter cionae]GGA17773.1 thiol-disulfide oxidoreductase [Amylibacter cionae]